jgi:hypothetical protein
MHLIGLGGPQDLSGRGDEGENPWFFLEWNIGSPVRCRSL